MIYVAFHYHTALLVSSYSLTVHEALFAEADTAIPIEVVLIFHLQASHTAILILLLNIRRKVQEIDHIELMLIATGIIVLDVQHLTPQTIKFHTSLAEPRTLLQFFAEFTLPLCMNRIDWPQNLSTTASSIDVCDQLPRL